MASKDPHVVVIGGGTGSFALLSGLKHHTTNITSLVNMADDGGSTGTLRDEIGVLPPGDARQCLVALSNSPKMRDLFAYRFNEGGLEGHAFGNLFLAALEKINGNFAEGVETASELLNITGRVVPITLDDVRLILEADDGFWVRGQHKIDSTRINTHGATPKLYLEPAASLNPEARRALLEADMVVVAPGDIYTSLGPLLIVDGMAEVLQQTTAKIVYVCNLVTKRGQTDGFFVHDFADEIERLGGGNFIDIVLYNNRPPSKGLLEKYAKDGEFAAAIDKTAMKHRSYTAISADLLSDVIASSTAGDPIGHSRSFIRHDSEKIARELLALL